LNYEGFTKLYIATEPSPESLQQGDLTLVQGGLNVWTGGVERKNSIYL